MFHSGVVDMTAPLMGRSTWRVISCVQDIEKIRFRTQGDQVTANNKQNISSEGVSTERTLRHACWGRMAPSSLLSRLKPGGPRWRFACVMNPQQGKDEGLRTQSSTIIHTQGDKRATKLRKKEGNQVNSTWHTSSGSQRQDGVRSNKRKQWFLAGSISA